MRRIIFAALAAALLLPATALAKDSNDDGLPDRWERKHDLSLKVKQSRRDQDRDGVRNKGEFRHGMDPRDDDSDGDGTEDGDEAGRVQSFDSDTGKLVIALLNGDTVSGKVTGDTEIECDASDDSSSTAAAARHGDDDDEGDDDDHSGPGRGGDDDDHGDDDDDDDRGGHHGDDDDRDHDRDCGTDALVEGARVHEAELKVTSNGAVWREVELAG